MGQIPQQLGRALRAGAAQSRAILVPHHLRAADGAAVRQRVGLCAVRTLVRHHGHDLGDDLPRLAHQHRVADADVLLGDIVLIMQGGVGHSGARQTHRLQLRLGSQHASASYLHHDIAEHRLLGLWRVLVGDGPAGTLGSTAKHLTLRQVVQLNDRAVDVEGETLPTVAQRGDLRQNIGGFG